MHPLRLRVVGGAPFAPKPLRLRAVGGAPFTP
ncbi:hypothetical protein H4W80_010993 [Nonomuraea angiospora]|uniref:Uncharacterized protein n=1 Tax=Nonomuraea angiospora TaxID=46172 RepID=A0ABR9MJL2_9ACTN|nr:hypothetical protein [Nonomuraea angiospora]